MALKKVEGETRFWKEDADRINQLSAKASAMGIAIQVVDGAPPALNPDGTLRQPNENSLEEFSEFINNCGGQGGKPGPCATEGKPITKGQYIGSGTKVKFHSGEHEGYTVTLGSVIQKRYSKEDTTYRGQIDSIKGGAGQVTVTEDHLAKHARIVSNCGGKGGKPGKCVLPKNPKKATIQQTAIHLHSTGHTLAMAPYDMIRRTAQYDVTHPDGTVKRMTAEEVKHLAYGKGKK